MEYMRKNIKYIAKAIIFTICLYLLQTCTAHKEEDSQDNGKKNGIVIRNNDSLYVNYYHNGKTKNISSIKNGNFTGNYNSFHENDTLATQGIMVDSLKTGVWKFYNTRGQLHEVIHYSLDSAAFKLDPSDFQFMRESLPLNGAVLQIEVPKTWIFKRQTQKVVFTLQKTCKGNTGFCPVMTMTKDKLNEISFSKYVEETLKLLPQMSVVEVVEQNELIIDGLPAFQVKYLSNPGGLLLGNIATFINHSDNVYIIMASSTNQTRGEFLKYSGLFEEITNSLQIHN